MKGSWCILLAIAVGSCAPVKESSRFVPTESPEEIIRLVNLRQEAVRTFQASGSISIETPSFDNSASFDVALRTSDSARITVAGPFGIHLASALFTQHHFVFYNSLKNEVIEGNSAFDAMPMMINVGMTPKEIVEIFTGERRIDFDHFPPDSFFIDGGSYVLLFRKGAGGTKYTVDGKTLTIKNIEVSDSSGNVITTEEYEYTNNDDGAVVPKLIRLIREASESSISLTYDSVLLNHTLPSLTLNIPSDAKRRTIETGNDVR